MILKVNKSADYSVLSEIDNFWIESGVEVRICVFYVWDIECIV